MLSNSVTIIADIFKCATDVLYMRKSVIVPLGVRHDNLFRIRVHNQIWIMCNNDNLAPLFGEPEIAG